MIEGLIDDAKASKLALKFEKYIYFDLCRAIFCINSWRYNRPHVGFYLTLNAALCKVSSEGNKAIKTYEDFLAFCKSIRPFLDASLDDEIIPDFGEIKIPFNEKFYSVFIGTGHNFLFPYMQSLEIIARKFKIEDKIERVLEYVDAMVKDYQRVEPYDAKKYKLRELSIPSKEYFKICNDKYRIYAFNDDVLSNLSLKKGKEIEESHFVNIEGNYYPLFNPSIIIDALYYYTKINPRINKKEVANSIVYAALIGNYDITPEHNKIISNVAVIKDFNAGTVVGNMFFNFAVIQQDTLLILFNKDECDQSDIDEVASNIKNICKNNSLQIAEAVEQRKCRVYDCSKINKIEVVAYDSKIYLGTDFVMSNYKNLTNLFLYDLISIIYQSNTSRDIVDFFLKKREQNTFSPCFYGGYSTLFEAWMTQNKEFSQGAIEFGNIFTDVYLVEWDIFDKFRDLNEWYPFTTYTKMFSNPFSWDFEKEETLGFRRIASLSVHGFGGSIRKVDSTFLFLAFNYTFEKTEEFNQRAESIRLINELTERNLVQIEEALIESGFYCFNGVQITYMPIDYAKKVDNNGFLTQNKEYVYSDVFFSEGRLFIRFAVNEEKLYKDILDAKDKRVECSYINELLSCVKDRLDINYDIIETAINKKRNDKKDIEAVTIDLNYIFSNNNMGIWPMDDDFIKVRKSIAKMCKEIDVNPGIYTSSEATQTIRNVQERIIPSLEEELSKFDKVVLHKLLLFSLAYYLHEKRIEQRRFSIIDSDFLNEQAKLNTEDNVIKRREECKNAVRVINYLIETNLAIKHNGDKNVEVEEIKYLLAFAHWLLVLQDCSDEAHYNLFDTKIKIEEDFRISTIISEEYSKIAEKRNKRIYNNIDYKPKLQNDEEMFQKTIHAFYSDTKVHLESIIQVCEYLSKEFSAVFTKQEIPDVYQINKQDLIEDYTSILVNPSEENIKNFCDALNYLIIDENQIKVLKDGKVEQYVPVWDRENRTNRFDVRPILEIGDDLIFSPVAMYELRQVWTFGTFDFYPPFEYGLKFYKKELETWKSACERQMEFDIEGLFKSIGCETRRNLQLHKLDKKYGHPKSLGDYDVIAVDKMNKILWNIESKLLGRVGSIREYYNHQDSFFNRTKKDEKFANRIAYLENNKIAVLKALGINDVDEFEIKNYMVTNKVFTSDVKKISFDIITFYELKKLIGCE